MPSFRLWPSNSLQQRVFIAFALIITPIGFMLYKTGNVLENQLQQSYQQTRTALELDQQSNTLERLAEDIVRAARQYQIVQQKTILNRLSQQLTSYRNQLSVHQFISEQAPQKSQLTQLLALSDQALLQSERLAQLPLLTRALSQASHERMINQIQELQQQAEDTRQALWLQTALLVLATLALMLFLTSVISRPIAALVQRIQAIGRREEQPHTPLHGPAEIVTLDKQLTWLDHQLRQLEQHKALFIQHISHELKTPLTTLREGAELLFEEVPGPLNPRQRHVVNLMCTSSLNLQKLIEQLLDYNRLQQPFPLQRQAVELRQLIHETLARLQLPISAKSIELKLQESYPVIEQDADMVNRVISNLISNAVHYTNEQGTVSIRARCHKQLLELEVENTGHAIAEQDVARIFEPFYQGSGKRQGPLKGTGIGLSIAYEAARAMHGKLTLPTNQEGCIVFRLSLPLETP